MESTFRAIALANVVISLPIGLYYRVRSQASGEKLARREEGLVILIGDHQPPAIVGGQSQPPWTVPIHVLSRDPELVAPFLADGYVSGLDPTQAPPHLGMETFLGRFLAAFNRPGPT